MTAGPGRSALPGPPGERPLARGALSAALRTVRSRLRRTWKRERGAAPAEAGETEILGTVAPLLGRERFLRVLVDLTDSCNLKCIMCHFSLPGRDQLQSEISIEEFERLAPQILPCVRYLGLSCATEPFMHRDFLRVLDVVRSHGVPHVYYITNATMLTEKAVAATLRAGVHQVTISLDGATAATFETIRRNARFEKVLANVRRLRDAKAQAGSELPRLQFNITLMRTNIEEIEDWLRLVKELGGQDVDLRHVVPYEGLDTRALSLFEHKELSNHWLGRARSLAGELGLHMVTCPDDFDLAERGPEAGPGPEPAGAPAAGSHLRTFCRMPWTMTLIHPDGGVVPCTNWFTHELMGNVKEQSFEEIWNGPKYRQLREQLLSNDLGPNCRVCPAMACGSVDREESFRARKV